MPQLPFIATHDGVSIKCSMTVDKRLAVSKVEVLEGAPLTIDPRRRVWSMFTERAELLTDLLRAGMPFEMLATCRHATTATGGLVEGAFDAWNAVAESLQSPGQAVEA